MDPKSVYPRARRWQQLMALMMLINLLLVGFHLTYLKLRGIYLSYAPALVYFYDPLLGVSSHPTTQAYLDTVNRLQGSVAQSGINSEQTAAILGDLREQSDALISENPYLSANQMPIFAKLKRRMRGAVGTVSARSAFQQFWQTQWLTQKGWQESIGFFEGRIRPLLERNYYRQVSDSGQYVDQFWRLDLFFVCLFAVDLLGRTYILSRRNEVVNLGDAIARNWYDLLLLLPFWRWLRIVPTVVRVHRSQLFNIERLVGQVTYQPAAYLSDRISKFVLIRLINQTKDSVQSGALMASWGGASGSSKHSPSKLDRLSDRLLQLVIYRVLPEVKPDLQGVLRYSLQSALSRSDLYEDLQQVPGLNALPQNALDALANYLAEATCDVLAESYKDEESRVLINQLSQDFRIALGRELQDENASTEIKQLLGELLEELKRSYINKSEEENPEITLEEVDRLHQKSS